MRIICFAGYCCRNDGVDIVTVFCGYYYRIILEYLEWLLTPSHCMSSYIYKFTHVCTDVLPFIIDPLADGFLMPTETLVIVPGVFLTSNVECGKTGMLFQFVYLSVY
jgi:hypothetical protein